MTRVSILGPCLALAVAQSNGADCAICCHWSRVVVGVANGYGCSGAEGWVCGNGQRGTANVEMKDLGNYLVEEFNAEIMVRST